MKQQIILWIGALLLLMAGMAGCEKAGKNELDDDNPLQQQDQPNTNQPEEEPVIPTALIGSWKLAGFVRTTDNAFEEIELKDCTKCYTITFLKDGTFTGYTSANEVRGKYKVDETLRIVKWEGTSINEQPDGRRYVSAMHNISRIDFMGDLLKLYYDNSQKQLLFYRKKNETLPVIPSELIGSWKLEGFGDTKTNAFREAEPKDCTICYTLIFLRNGMLTGKSSTNEMIGEYVINEQNIKIRLGGTKKGEIFDGNKYTEVVNNIHRFEIVSKKLKLYYNDGKHYLRFKRTVQLTGTRWDLAGVVDAKTGKITPLAPKGSYWFKFISETKARGGSVLNIMAVNLTSPPFFNIETEIGDSHNGDAALFYRIIRKLESYTWEENELKFFYDNKRYYLLYTCSNS